MIFLQASPYGLARNFMKNLNDAEKDQKSGLLRGSDALEDVRRRSLSKKDDDDAGKDGESGDDDSTDSDKMDSDTTDKGDSRDIDGKD
jgi:hypothetical protein